MTFGLWKSREGESRRVDRHMTIKLYSVLHSLYWEGGLFDASFRKQQV